MIRKTLLILLAVLGGLPTAARPLFAQGAALRYAVVGDANLTPSIIGSFGKAAKDARLDIELVARTSADYTFAIAQEQGTGGNAAAIFVFGRDGELVASVVRSGRATSDGTIKACAEEAAKQVIRLRQNSEGSEGVPTPKGAPSAGVTVFSPGNGVTSPKLVREVKPRYTAEAMHARITGDVWIRCVVETDGKVDRVEVLRSLDTVYGLDDEAKIAAAQWRFEPGTRLGVPVPVQITISLSFNLKD